MKMENAFEQEKKEKIDKAACMDKVPLNKLHELINYRRLQALERDIEGVEITNEMIKRLLAL